MDADSNIAAFTVLERRIGLRDHGDPRIDPARYERGADCGEAIAGRLIKLIQAEQSFSLVRVGDGEGGVALTALFGELLAHENPVASALQRAVNQPWTRMIARADAPKQEKMEIANALIEACRNATILGVPCHRDTVAEIFTQLRAIVNTHPEHALGGLGALALFELALSATPIRS